MAKKIDRRVKYTMNLLKDSLIELMEDKHISKISVKELCDKADVNRSTFYAHYSDVYDLLRQMENELFENLSVFLAEQQYDDKIPVSESKLEQILKFIGKDDRTLRVLIGENSDIAIQRDIIQYLGVAALQANIKASDEHLEYINLYCIHGCISIIQKWLQAKMPEPPEEIASLIFTLLADGINGF